MSQSLLLLIPSQTKPLISPLFHPQYPSFTFSFLGSYNLLLFKRIVKCMSLSSLPNTNLAIFFSTSSILNFLSCSFSLQLYSLSFQFSAYIYKFSRKLMQDKGKTNLCVDVVGDDGVQVDQGGAADFAEVQQAVQLRMERVRRGRR